MQIERWTQVEELFEAPHCYFPVSGEMATSIGTNTRHPRKTSTIPAFVLSVPIRVNPWPNSALASTGASGRFFRMSVHSIDWERLLVLMLRDGGGAQDS
jgi:hypothetical protein